MQIGDRITVSKKQTISESKVTYKATFLKKWWKTKVKKKEIISECGYVTIEPSWKIQGTIIDRKKGWFVDSWIVALDDGQIIRI